MHIYFVYTDAKTRDVLNRNKTQHIMCIKKYNYESLTLRIHYDALLNTPTNKCL